MISSNIKDRFNRELSPRLSALSANELRQLVLALVEREYEECKTMNCHYSVKWACDRVQEQIDKIVEEDQTEAG